MKPATRALFADAPLAWHEIAEDERVHRSVLDAECCVIDDCFHFLRACIELPVCGTDEHFVWGVWVAVGERSYLAWSAWRASSSISSVPDPFLGWMDTRLAPYPDTKFLKVRVRVRTDGELPLLELENDEHPLARECRDGISGERMAELCAVIAREQEQAA